jgi:hypothetical protein
MLGGIASAVVAAASAGVSPQPIVQRGEEVRWSGPQSIHADSEGNVFLLRGDPLMAYRIGRDHQIGSPVRLAAHLDGPYRVGALSGRGEWLALGGNSVYRTTADDFTTSPSLDWLALSVGFVDGDPWVVLSRSSMKRSSGEKPAAPFVVRWSGDDWVAEVADPAPPDAAALADPSRAISDRSALLLGDRNGRYFLARFYEYVVEIRRRGAAKPLETLRVGPPGMKERPPIAGEEVKLSDRVKPTNGGRVGVFRGLEALVGMARAPQGELLLLTGEAIGKSGCGLDRVDWDRRRVDRLALDTTCPRSMAAGRDGLYFAAGTGDGPRHFLSWESLESARWEHVAEAVFEE